MKILSWFAYLALVQFATANPDKDEKEKEPEEFQPCTLRSPNTGSFFDLSPIYKSPPPPHEKPEDEKEVASYLARGHDYGANFTMNFCGAVVEPLRDVVGVERDKWQNISAYYVKNGKTYAIGMQNEWPVFRGRKMVLNYTDGSPCDGPDTEDQEEALDSGLGDNKNKPDWKHSHAQHTHDSHVKATQDENVRRRKSTVISLLCERDPLAPDVHIAFVGWSPDKCAYFFEAKTHAACPAVNVAKQQVGPSGVFGIIAAIAIAVYVVGGVVYQRTVMHQRGWRQLPNYALWSGITNFVSDIFIILFSSCTRCLPRRRGYSQVSQDTFGGRGGSATSRRNEDENRLIGELDEEWED